MGFHPCALNESCESSLGPAVLRGCQEEGAGPAGSPSPPSYLQMAGWTANLQMQRCLPSCRGNTMPGFIISPSPSGPNLEPPHFQKQTLKNSINQNG